MTNVSSHRLQAGAKLIKERHGLDLAGRLSEPAVVILCHLAALYLEADGALERLHEAHRNTPSDRIPHTLANYAHRVATLEAAKQTAGQVVLAHLVSFQPAPKPIQPPKSPPGVPEYADYAAQLKAELARFQAGDVPPDPDGHMYQAPAKNRYCDVEVNLPDRVRCGRPRYDHAHRPRFESGDRARITNGKRLYRVIATDIGSAVDKATGREQDVHLARLEPLDPDDERTPFWVGMDILVKVWQD